ncbi:dockerin type I repeat-containing protein [Acetivibrio thermocellus]|uniref:dockerin type I repeat-containing protein n=1 Tax=Acetivibrio thermocellus TaxID=1515 RepID=UPI0034D95F44
MTRHYQYGDLNGDNNINSSDYTLLKRYLLHTIRESPEKRPHPHFGEKYSGVDNLSNLIDLSYLK